MDILPNFQNVIIKKEKLILYCLNKNSLSGGKDKAIAFERALGYNISNYLDLIRNIKDNLSNFPAKLKSQTKYGTLTVHYMKY